VTSKINRASLSRRRTIAVRLPECRCTFVELSWRIRNKASSASRGSRPRERGISSLVWIPLRLVNPSTYQDIADCAAACPPRIVFAIPAFFFFSRPCFSISVALAGKIAGNARKRPPKTGPYFLATSPVRTVIAPAKNETHDVLVPFCFSERGQMYGDSHIRLSQNHNP
jgi:hypothetical protein